MHKVLGLLRTALLDSAALSPNEKLFGRRFLFPRCPVAPSHPLAGLSAFLLVSLPQRVSLEDSLGSITVPFYGK